MPSWCTVLIGAYSPESLLCSQPMWPMELIYILYLSSTSLLGAEWVDFRVWKVIIRWSPGPCWICLSGSMSADGVTPPGQIIPKSPWLYFLFIVIRRWGQQDHNRVYISPKHCESPNTLYLYTLVERGKANWFVRYNAQLDMWDANVMIRKYNFSAVCVYFLFTSWKS